MGYNIIHFSHTNKYHIFNLNNIKRYIPNDYEKNHIGKSAQYIVNASELTVVITNTNNSFRNENKREQNNYYTTSGSRILIIFLRSVKKQLCFW